MPSPQRSNDQDFSGEQCAVESDELDPEDMHLSSGIDTALSLLPPPLVSAARAAATTVGNSSQSALPFPMSVEDFNELTSDLNLNSLDLELLLSDTQYLQLPEDLSSGHNTALPMALSGLPTLVDSAQPLSPPHDPLQNLRSSLTASHANTFTTASITEKAVLASFATPTSSPEMRTGQDTPITPKTDTDLVLQKTSQPSPYVRSASSALPSTPTATPLTSTPFTKNILSTTSQRAKSKQAPSRSIHSVQRKSQTSARSTPPAKASLLKIAPRSVAPMIQEGKSTSAQLDLNLPSPVLDSYGLKKGTEQSASVLPSPGNVPVGQAVSLNGQEDVRNAASISSGSSMVHAPRPAPRPVPGQTQIQTQPNERPSTVNPLSVNIASAHPGILPLLHYQIHPSFLQQSHLSTPAGEAPAEFRGLHRQLAFPLGSIGTKTSNGGESLPSAHSDPNSIEKLDAPSTPLTGQSMSQPSVTSPMNLAHVHTSPEPKSIANYAVPPGIPHMSPRLVYDPSLLSCLGLQPFTYTPIISAVPNFNVTATVSNPVLVQTAKVPDAPAASSSKTVHTSSDPISKSDLRNVKPSGKLEKDQPTGGFSISNDDESNAHKPGDDQKISDLNVTPPKVSDSDLQIYPASEAQKVMEEPESESDPVVISVDGVQKKFFQQSAARLDRHPVLGRLQLMDRGSSFTASTSNTDAPRNESADVLKSKSSNMGSSDATHDLKDNHRKPYENHDNVLKDGRPCVGDPAKVNRGNSRSRGLKKRLVWTPELHERFVKAVESVGLNQAVPKTIVTIMNVEGLTTEHVKSHLQKYRNSLRKDDEEKKPNDNICSADLAACPTVTSNVRSGAEDQKEKSGCNVSVLPSDMRDVEENGPHLSTKVTMAPITSPGHETVPSTMDRLKKGKDGRLTSAPISGQDEFYVEGAANLLQTGTRPVERGRVDKLTNMGSESHISNIEAQNSLAVVTGIDDKDIGKKPGRDRSGSDRAEVSSPLSGGSNSQTQRDLELELVKERTLKLQLQLQVMVHRTIALNRRFQQQREREHIQGGQEESGRSVCGRDLSEPPATTDLNSNSETPTTKEEDMAAGRRSKRGVDLENLESDEGLKDSRYREKRRRTGIVDGGSNGDRALVQTELSALLSVQMEMSRNLEETRVLLDGRSGDR